MDIDLTAAEPQTFYEQRIRDLDLRGARIDDKVFDACVFERCSFVECLFANCRFLDCVFESCTLSATRVAACAFSAARFIESKVIGVNWTDAATLNGLRFEGCELSYSVFNSLKLRKLVLKSCRCLEVDFEKADLTDGDFGGTDFAGSTFHQTNLSNASFQGAVNYAIDVRSNMVKKAKFSFPEALTLLRGLGIVITDV